jgi:hypothetical protein
MTNLQNTQEPIDTEIIEEALTPEEEKAADSVEAELFDSKENGEKTVATVQSFVESYSKNKDTMKLDEWLVAEFKKYPQIWKNDEEIKSTASEIIETAVAFNENNEDLVNHVKSGKSKESWLESKISENTSRLTSEKASEYVANIGDSLNNANQMMANTILNQNGEVSRQLHLHGFIAETHHVNTFNLDATAKNSSLYAEIIPPTNGYTANGVDIQIKDSLTGKVVRRYQAKYGQSAEHTLKAFEKGDYRGQQKLVPDGHEGHFEKATTVIETDGISSKRLSHEESKEMQRRAQEQKISEQYKWEGLNKKAIVQNIGKDVLIGATFNAGFQGARILGRRMWNSLRGKENSSSEADMREYFESSLRGAKDVGVQVAVSGAVVVAAKNRWIKTLEHTPVKSIVNIVSVGISNAKIMYKMAKGEVSFTEGVDAMGMTTYSAMGGIAGAETGAGIGASIGAIGGPIGIAIGGFVGAVAGGIAGSKYGEAIYKVHKKVVSVTKDIAVTTAKAVISVGQAAWEGVKSIGKALNPLNWF